MKHRIVVAVTGASGAIYARQLLQKLEKAAAQTEAVAIVMTENAKTVWETELGTDDYKILSFKTYTQQDFMAPFASGSGRYDTMIICPCSMGTLGRIAGGMSNDLITRAADVVLKERRKLICVVRETPYNVIHIKNMLTVTEAGGIICPATPSFYSVPSTLEEVAATVVDRVIDLAGIQQDTYRWGQE
ncbi:UbiX family flavin prenyltransferase [Chitinophaga sancti]|uniref:UbiX family flavin prenyltransferase n=1 Tax=Chitinophaga sancti TaxID=1004 RepID=UPI002A75443C|nr:UbiX family flavin prenyltransferase [Chitinophaga sancti]WPQ65705.1 UbiX family flavin prenyltransferase [Chitinophaga sancti]